MTSNNPQLNVGFNTPVHFMSATEVVLTGTVSDSVANLEFFDGTMDLGPATLNGDGTWSIDTQLDPGQHRISAVATDTSGNAAFALTPFVLLTGLTQQSYASVEYNLDANDHVYSFNEFDANGNLYAHARVTDFANGEYRYTYTKGKALNGSLKVGNLYTPDNNKAQSVIFHSDGTHTTTGYQDNQTFKAFGYDTFTAGGVRDKFIFQPGFGQDLITDFKPGGAKHDTLNFALSEFTGFADVLHNTQNVAGSAVITDPSTGDQLTLTGVTKAELKANHGDFKFHS